MIAQSKLPDGGNTVRRLHQLEEAGFITSLVPYGRKDKGLYYVMDDEYSLFYLYWIEPKKKMGVFKKRTKTKKQLFFSMITTMGLKPTMYSEELISNEAVLDDLFKKI